MVILKGKYIGEESYTSKKDYKVRQIGIQEEGKILPKMVNVKPDFVNNFKVGQDVSLEVYLSAYDVDSKKYLSSKVKFALMSVKA